MNNSYKDQGTTKTCPACGNTFTCNAANIAQCDCATVELTPQQAEFISKNYKDCLCINCLKDISRRFPHI